MAKAIIFCSFILSAACGSGRDLYVSLNGGNIFPYTNWPDAATNIEWAVNAGANGDSVWISNGIYVLTNQVTVRSNINICGFNGRPVVDGNNSNRCFYISAASGGTLSNLFITRGNTNANGGGVFIANNGNAYNCIFSNNTALSGNGGGLYGGTQIVACAFIGNTAKGGGGLCPVSGVNTFIAECTFQANTAGYGGVNGNGGGMNLVTFRVATNCVFTDNVASNGGGIYGSGAGYIINCQVVSNIAETGDGGGLYINNNSCIVSNCFISGNIASNSGGGVCLQAGKVANCTLSDNTAVYDANWDRGGGGIFLKGVCHNCIIDGNRAGCGGGVYLNGTTGYAIDCLIRDNVSLSTWMFSGGGGAFSRAGTLYLNNCTVVSNCSAGNGGGLNGPSPIVVENSIIYFNTSATANSNYYLSSSGCALTNSCFAPNVGGAIAANSTNNLIANPQFVDPASGDYRLKNESPCIDTGVNRPWMLNAVDLDGRMRIRYETVDMGAYEKLFGMTIFNIY